MSHIETNSVGHILEIHINRPEKLNALTPEMFHDLALALARLDADPSLRVGLIYASGKHFSAGIELDRWGPIFETGEGFPQTLGGLNPFALSGPRCRKPLVFCTQGLCYTWGVELMLTTDVRVASDDSSFGMLEVTRGIYPCGGATIRLPEQMGWANAHRYLLTGDTWGADEAHRTGLVQKVVPAGEQLSVAKEIAESIANAAPLGVQAILKSTRLAASLGEQKAAEHLFDDMPAIMKSEDAKEGIRSFIERRRATFSGE